MAQVHELLEQQKDFFKTLLEQQANNFKSCVEILVDSSNKRIGELLREVTDLRASLEYTQREFQDFKNSSKLWVDSCKETKSDMVTICKTLITVNDKTMEG